MGQKKKAFMCFALAANTSLLLMDEPSNGLDIPSKSQFRKVIASGMTDDKSVIISTHQVRDIDSLLDHVVIIDGTHVLLNESVKDICAKLYFAEQGMNEPTGDALYVQPSVQGNSVILSNVYNEETKLNLEVLFNAMLAEREKMQCLKNKNALISLCGKYSYSKTTSHKSMNPISNAYRSHQCFHMGNSQKQQ